MSKMLTATLTIAALLGAGVYGGTLIGDQVSSEIAAVAPASTQTGTSTGPVQSTETSSQTRSTATPNDVTAAGIDKSYSRIRAERDTGAERAQRDYAASGILPEVGDPNFNAVVQANLAQVADVSRDGVPDNPWLTWDVAAPGMAIGVDRSSGASSACTLGFIGERAGTYYGLTAGHCMQGSAAQANWKKSGEPGLSPFGEFVVGQVRDGSLSDNAPFTTDFAAIAISDSVPGDMAVAKSYTVSDVYSADDLQIGMEVCKLGFRTEETCGKVLAKNNSMVRVGLFSLPGDSGSPAYVKLGDDRIAAVGLLSGSPEIDGETFDTLTDFALIEPIIEHTGLNLMPYIN